ncbi:hypothetical protein EJ06DRAFT_346359 [Trichodelitschia bisporula]|uniref:Uncharacterized protein n=1 Tax=Trichodelitschia bisporula TaxID=703511 RepID=A0A6G1I2R3_9PEZI|nr:hypothetical protein EJ06DRAFT_346359 [Trichodelitschia bisporula]
MASSEELMEHKEEKRREEKRRGSEKRREEVQRSSRLNTRCGDCPPMLLPPIMRTLHQVRPIPYRPAMLFLHVCITGLDVPPSVETRHQPGGYHQRQYTRNNDRAGNAQEASGRRDRDTRIYSGQIPNGRYVRGHLDTQFELLALFRCDGRLHL